MRSFINTILLDQSDGQSGLAPANFTITQVLYVLSLVTGG